MKKVSGSNDSTAVVAEADEADEAEAEADSKTRQDDKASE